MRRIELGFEREGRGEEMEYTKSTDNSILSVLPRKWALGSHSGLHQAPLLQMNSSSSSLHVL